MPVDWSRCEQDQHLEPQQRLVNGSRGVVVGFIPQNMVAQYAGTCARVCACKRGTREGEGERERERETERLAACGMRACERHSCVRRCQRPQTNARECAQAFEDWYVHETEWTCVSAYQGNNFRGTENNFRDIALTSSAAGSAVKPDATSGGKGDGGKGGSAGRSASVQISLGRDGSGMGSTGGCDSEVVREDERSEIQESQLSVALASIRLGEGGDGSVCGRDRKEGGEPSACDCRQGAMDSETRGSDTDRETDTDKWTETATDRETDTTKSSPSQAQCLSQGVRKDVHVSCGASKMANLTSLISPQSNDGDMYPVVQFVGGRREAMLPEVFEYSVFSVGTCKRVQVPLKLAWALTIHKAQGQSLDKVTVDLRGCFADGQCYVALSRARSARGLQVKNFRRGVVKTNSLAKGFHEHLSRGHVAAFVKATSLWWHPLECPHIHFKGHAGAFAPHANASVPDRRPVDPSSHGHRDGHTGEICRGVTWKDNASQRSTDEYQGGGRGVERREGSVEGSQKLAWSEGLDVAEGEPEEQKEHEAGLRSWWREIFLGNRHYRRWVHCHPPTCPVCVAAKRRNAMGSGVVSGSDFEDDGLGGNVDGSWEGGDERRGDGGDISEEEVSDEV